MTAHSLDFIVFPWQMRRGIDGTVNDVGKFVLMNRHYLLFDSVLACRNALYSLFGVGLLYAMHPVCKALLFDVHLAD